MILLGQFIVPKISINNKKKSYTQEAKKGDQALLSTERLQVHQLLKRLMQDGGGREKKCRRSWGKSAKRKRGGVSAVGVVSPSSQNNGLGERGGWWDPH